ncbi:hypothetical protein JOF29_007838 [Kribbella aluminosa]|uniref:Uncharacterized protein n=1 Tax=Kribbella aluminosa TaxID=416017 RepID=A0ABS4UYK7_9ACTN|nr:hypothetical protein [Kribbella aluminosa]
MRLDVAVALQVREADDLLAVQRDDRRDAGAVKTA